MIRLSTLRLSVACLVITLCTLKALADPPPNLIVILTDDQGYADVGFNGCKDIPTPNIDRIAQQGARCTNGYVTFAVCGPSRAGLITGRYQDRFGALRNPTVDPSVPNNGVPTSEKNIAELLKPVGYTTMAIGKWHLGTHPDLRPTVRGFDHFFGFLSGGHRYFPEELTLDREEDSKTQWDWYKTKILRNDKPIVTHKYLTDEFSDAAVDFIELAKNKPFFLYLAYNAPHAPLQAPPQYLNRFPNITNPKRKTYAAMVSAVDDGVGRVLDKLHELKLDDNTIVFFLSDNGGPDSNGSNNWPLRRHKGTPFEGGIRVPFAVRWTGKIPAGTVYDKPVSSLDIAATIAHHSGAKPAQDKPLDGVDLVPFLDGSDKTTPHPQLYWRFYNKELYVVREGDTKLIYKDGETDQLYDLGKDIGEKSNLYQDHADEITALRSLIDEWKKPMVGPLSGGISSWKFKED
ncbi:MAG: sulfatase-like hydrolase/transferase [Phycisphaera sp.]|nr:sulfatase-like hydrolase/transferase [Phycisphaera sp.]